MSRVSGPPTTSTVQRVYNEARLSDIIIMLVWWPAHAMVVLDAALTMGCEQMLMRTLYARDPA